MFQTLKSLKFEVRLRIFRAEHATLKIGLQISMLDSPKLQCSIHPLPFCHHHPSSLARHFFCLNVFFLFVSFSFFVFFSHPHQNLKPEFPKYNFEGQVPLRSSISFSIVSQTSKFIFEFPTSFGSLWSGPSSRMEYRPGSDSLL